MKIKWMLAIVGGMVAILTLTVLFIVLAVETRREEERPSYKRLLLAVTDDDPFIGLSEAKRYIRKNPESANAQLILAGIYDEKLGMPLEAIGAYQRYLELTDDPNEHAKAEEWITSARKRCFLAWRKEFDHLSASARVEEIIKLRNEVRELRIQLEQATGQSSTPIPAVEPSLPPETSAPIAISTPVTAAAPAEDTRKAETPPTAETYSIYTVKRGDSLTRIAREFYGSGDHTDAIYQANKDVMSSPNALRVGQKLKIPKLANPAPAPAPSAPPSAPKPVEPLKPIKPLTLEQQELLSRNATTPDSSKTPADGDEKKGSI